MFCSSCGRQIPEQVAFCANCGAPSSATVAPLQPRRSNPLLVALLVIIALMIVGAAVIVLTIGSVAVPKMQRAIRQAAEVSATQQIHIIQTAQAQYFSKFGRYAASLAELGPPSGGGGSDGTDLIPADLASGVKGGYRFALKGTGNAYQLHASPITYGKSGVRNFYADESLTIHENAGSEPATAVSHELR
jgi:type IV pilus assembly protein PilA